MTARNPKKAAAKVGDDKAPGEYTCFYNGFARPIPVAGLSVGKVFFHCRDGIHAISRRDLEKKGKAYDRRSKEWFYLTEGAALAAYAKWRQRQQDEADALSAVRAAHQAARRVEQTAVAAAAQQQRDAESAKVRKLKAEMAAAHPDHGGNSAAFIVARERYLTAKAIAEREHRLGR